MQAVCVALVTQLTVACIVRDRVCVFAWFGLIAVLLPWLCCMQGNPRRAVNFDRMFTCLKMENTPVDSHILRQRPNAFVNFSYCNPVFLNDDDQITRL